jgi:putative membrane protein
MKRIMLAAGAAFMLALPATMNAETNQAAQTPPKPASSKPAGAAKAHHPSEPGGTLAATDRAFVMEAARGGMAEVEMGRVAVTKASNADVKQFGQRMVDDHGKANDELKSWASGKNVTLPTEISAKQKADLARLSKLSGAAFDRANMTDMVADHNKDVAAFQHASTTAKDPDLKSWAEKTLPTLQEHQKMAKEISAKVKGGAAAAPAKK